MSEKMKDALDAAINVAEMAKARAELCELIQSGQYVGEVFSIAYETSKVQIHDHHRRKVGGIPALCFLLATRISPNTTDIKPFDEDSSVILLRVMDAIALPDSEQVEEVRVARARDVSGETAPGKHMDQIMDDQTQHRFGYAGVGCRIIGTFYIEQGERNLHYLCFGSDISNYYPNRGLKVYKPVGKALEAIVNYVRPADKTASTAEPVSLGRVRYASADRKWQNVDSVPVVIYPTDLLAQKTAVFGMTRIGKSNTMKIIAQSIYNLRQKEQKLRIGQIIFDPNGEYANENEQDKNKQDNKDALKNVYKSMGAGVKKENEVATYGIDKHDDDPDRKFMKLNFYLLDNLQTGKEIIDNMLAGDRSKYLSNFRDVVFDAPDKRDYPAMTRFNRRVLFYRALLHKAGFRAPENMSPITSGLFRKQKEVSIMEALQKSKKHSGAAQILEKETLSWHQIGEVAKIIRDFIRQDEEDEYTNFEKEYRKSSSSGESWADDELQKILEMFHYPNGSRLVGRALVYHSQKVETDYTDDIYKDLEDGKLVIVDQSTGDPDINADSARRIMTKIFQSNLAAFRSAKTPPGILMYVEEAHNILPSDRTADLKDIWVRAAKEGAKLNIGMVYSTQEVSSIQSNILKNTANWFIGHLNNTDETKKLKQYYDFANFEGSILRAQDKGFLRVKTLSNPYVIPVQVNKFEI